MNKKYQRVGLHVSAAGGVENAPDRAREFGAECFQFFSRSPRGGGAPTITDEQVESFRNKCKEYNFESYIHTPYYVNFASQNKRIWHGTVNAIKEELTTASRLGVKYVVTHMGSAKDFAPGKHAETPKEALDLAVKGLKEVFKDTPEFESTLLLEISAGAGSVVGNKFEELAYLLEGLGRDDVHICLDTCHMFASGYDLRDEEAINVTMDNFKKEIGISRFKLLHLNDSKTDLDKRVDRHDHIGEGFIGKAGFKALLKHPDFQEVNIILETKHDDLINKDLDFLRKNRLQK